MFRSINKWFVCIALALFAAFSLSIPCSAQTYDLTSDWSDTNNPNGPWTYREGDNALPHVASWQSSLGGFSSPQQGWARSENGTDRLPFWFKSIGAETFTHDWQAGDVLVHTTDEANGVGNGPANVIWKSPVAGHIDLSGGVWMGRDIGRGNQWTLLVNNTTLSSGNISSGDAYDRAHPFDLSTGSGGSSVLNNIAVAAGDIVELRFDKTSNSGDFVGVQFTVKVTPVPAPAALVTAFMGALPGTTLLLRRRRK